MNAEPLYVGIAGVGCDADSYDLDHGVSLRTTYAHFMAPFLMAFAPPSKPGEPHPAPWAPASGGLGFDVTVELTVPSPVISALPLEAMTVAWWVVALLRLRTGPRLRAPVLSNYPFSKGSASAKDLQIRPLEVTPHQLNLDPEAGLHISAQDLDWTRKNWMPSLKLLGESTKFGTLFESLDQAAFNSRPQLALLVLWTGLEDMFSPSKSELRYRISSLIAAYLEPPGQSRLERQKSIAKLYDKRSVAAHGGGDVAADSLWATYYLAREVILKIIADSRVPTREELEGRMFGVGT